MSEMEERVFWERFKGKFIKLTKSSNNNDYYYSGIVKEVLDDKIIIDDIKLGVIPISFSGLSLRGIGRGDRQ